jgi:hypothetical protein
VQYVRPYVRRNKTDRTDTEAMLEAARCGEENRDAQRLSFRYGRVKCVEKMQHVSYEQSQPVAAHVKLLRFICRGKHVPMLEQLVSVDVGELANFPHGRREFAVEQIEHVAILKLAQYHSRCNVVEAPAIGSPVQLDGEAAPSLDFALLPLGFKRHRLFVLCCFCKTSLLRSADAA